MSDKIDKKTLREDAFQNIFFSFAGYFHKNQGKVIGSGIGVVLIIAVVVLGFVYSKYSKALEISDFYSVEQAFETKETDKKKKTEITIKALKLFLDKHPEGVLAPTAWLTLAQISWKEKDYLTSENYFSEALKHSQTSTFSKNIARMGVAKAKEMKGDTKGALEIVKTIPAKLFPDLRDFEEGRLSLNLKKNDIALEKLNSLKGGKSIYSRLASDLLIFGP